MDIISNTQVQSSVSTQKMVIIRRKESLPVMRWFGFEVATVVFIWKEELHDWGLDL